MVLPADDHKPLNARPKGRKVTGSLLALGAAAVVSVYSIGYLRTQSSIDDLNAQIQTTSAPAAPAQAIAPQTTGPARTIAPQATVPAPAAGAPRSAATPAPAASTQKQTYADGSYTGTGTSRHGSITATVVISKGKIVSASVSSCGTRYPCSEVNPLVSAVVSDQSVPASHVSGATDSSNAYKTAVRSALQKAQATA